MKVAMITLDEDGIPSHVLEEIRSADVEIVCKKCGTTEESVAFSANADVIWIFGPNPGIDAGALELLPHCRALFRSGSGVDQLPVSRATELGIAICNTPESIAESVAEHAAALLLALVRQVPQLDRDVRAQGTKAWTPSGTPRLRWHLSGRTLGLVGHGRIAQLLEKMMSGFNVDVIHCDPLSPASLPLEEVLRRADFLSLHCPLTPATRKLINAERLALMKPGALLVNTSRGDVIDETALVEALRGGTLGGAALDVTCAEPLNPDSPLLVLDNVIITPHMAAFSGDFEKNFWAASVKKIMALSTGNYAENSINLPPKKGA